VSLGKPRKKTEEQKRKEGEEEGMGGEEKVRDIESEKAECQNT